MILKIAALSAAVAAVIIVVAAVFFLLLWAWAEYDELEKLHERRRQIHDAMRASLRGQNQGGRSDDR